MPRPTPLQNAFTRLEKKGIAAEAHFTCCGSCASAALDERIDEEDLEGGTYFHAQDTESAAESGELYLGFNEGSLDQFDVACKVLRELTVGRIAFEWAGNVSERILVHLGSRDQQWMQSIIDSETERWNGDRADEFHQRYLFSAFRQVLSREKRAAQVIGDAITAWSLKPGGVLFKRAKVQYENCKINS